MNSYLTWASPGAKEIRNGRYSLQWYDVLALGIHYLETPMSQRLSVIARNNRRVFHGPLMI